MCQEQRTANHTTSNFITKSTGPRGTEGPHSVAAPQQQQSTAQTCSGPRGEQSHARLLWVSVLRATQWSVRVKVRSVRVKAVPLLRLGQGTGRGASAWSICRHMYVDHEIIDAAHVAVNINGGCTDVCANVARAWQALHVLRVTGRHSNSSPH